MSDERTDRPAAGFCGPRSTGRRPRRYGKRNGFRTPPRRSDGGFAGQADSRNECGVLPRWTVPGAGLRLRCSMLEPDALRRTSGSEGKGEGDLTSLSDTSRGAERMQGASAPCCRLPSSRPVWGGIRSCGLSLLRRTPRDGSIRRTVRRATRRRGPLDVAGRRGAPLHRWIQLTVFCEHSAPLTHALGCANPCLVLMPILDRVPLASLISGYESQRGAPTAPRRRLGPGQVEGLTPPVQASGSARSCDRLGQTEPHHPDRDVEEPLSAGGMGRMSAGGR